MSNTTQEIPQNPQDFKKECQDKLYESVLNKIEQELANPKAKTSVADDNDEKTAKKKSCSCSSCIGAIASVLLLVVYAGLIVWIVEYLFDSKDVQCGGVTLCASNNTTTLLVVVLILATIVLIMSGIFILRYIRYCHEVCKDESEKKDDFKKKAEPSMTEVMIKRIQDAVFNEIVDDTIEAFKDKK